MPAAGAAASASSQRKPRARSPPLRRHDVHRVDAVGEIVREHRDRDDEAHGARGLKREPDRDAVEQAVSAQHRAPALPRGARIAVKRAESGRAPDTTRKPSALHARMAAADWKFRAESIASGSRSKNATPITAPALNPRIRCSLSRSPSASNPPARVLTKAATAMAKSSTLRFFHALRPTGYIVAHRKTLWRQRELRRIS